MKISFTPAAAATKNYVINSRKANPSFKAVNEYWYKKLIESPENIDKMTDSLILTEYAKRNEKSDSYSLPYEPITAEDAFDTLAEANLWNLFDPNMGAELHKIYRYQDSIKENFNLSDKYYYTFFNDGVIN